MNNIYIFIPVFNRLTTTVSFVSNLQFQTLQTYKLVLIDDGSVDGTAQKVLELEPDTIVIQGKGNWWWAGSLHQGYLWLSQQALDDNDIVLLINDDVKIDPNFLEIGSTLLQGKENGVLSAKAYCMQSRELVDEGIRIDWKKFQFHQAKSLEEITCFSTCGLFMYASSFLRLKGFRPNLLPHYTSDYEFTIRALRQGMIPLSDSRLSLWVNQSTTGYRFTHKNYPRFNFLQHYFSKKSADNPIYLIMFVCLACPWPWKFLNILRLLKRGISVIIKAAFRMEAA